MAKSKYTWEKRQKELAKKKKKEEKLKRKLAKKKGRSEPSPDDDQAEDLPE